MLVATLEDLVKLKTKWYKTKPEVLKANRAVTAVSFHYVFCRNQNVSPVEQCFVPSGTEVLSPVRAPIVRLGLACRDYRLVCGRSAASGRGRCRTVFSSVLWFRRLNAVPADLEAGEADASRAGRNVAD